MSYTNIDWDELLKPQKPQKSKADKAIDIFKNTPEYKEFEGLVNEVKEREKVKGYNDSKLHKYDMKKIRKAYQRIIHSKDFENAIDLAMSEQFENSF